MWNCTFILQLHNHHQPTPPGKREPGAGEHRCREGWRGRAQLELLVKLESKWRPRTFQRVKHCCCTLMTDTTAKTKSRDCHWKHPCWRTVIGSLWQIKVRQNRLVVFYKAANSDPFKCSWSEIWLWRDKTKKMCRKAVENCAFVMCKYTGLNVLITD